MLCSPDSYEMNMPPVNPDNSSLPLMVTFNLDINRQTKLQKVAFLFKDSFPSNIPSSALRTWWWRTWSLGSWWGSTFNGKIAGYIFRKLDQVSEMIIKGVCHCQKASSSYSFWSLIYRLRVMISGCSSTTSERISSKTTSPLKSKKGSGFL